MSFGVPCSLQQIFLIVLTVASVTFHLHSSMKNMRLILASRSAVAVDTVEALVMKCDPTKVPYLTKLAVSGLGTTDLARITVAGKLPSEVAVPFAGKQTDICPGL